MWKFFVRGLSILLNHRIFSSIGALEIQMSVCLLVGWSVTFTHNSVIFVPRSFKFCVVVDIEATKKIILKNFKFFDDDDDDNDDEDDYSHFRVFGHNSSKNNFLGLKPKNELFLSKNTTFLLNKFFSRMKLKFQKKNQIFFFNFFSIFIVS